MGTWSSRNIGTSMDFLTATVLSGFAYDAIKTGLAFTETLVKDKLKGWLIEDEVAVAVAEELGKLRLTDELSEIAIERKISSSVELSKLLREIKPVIEVNQIIQQHSGSGDNVGGNKITGK